MTLLILFYSLDEILPLKLLLEIICEMNHSAKNCEFTKDI